MEKSRTEQYVGWFREASPYIHRFRGETFVIALEGALLQEGHMRHLAHDIALLSSLGIRLVLAFGASPQIDEAAGRMDVRTERSGRRRITPPALLPLLMESVGRLRFEIEAALSQGTDATLMAGARIRVVSGNFVIGRPLGIIDGIDLLYTGTVRRIESEAICRHLDAGDLVLLSPVAFSPTGEVFNILAVEIASRAAIALNASKLIVLGDSPEIRNDRGEILRQLTLPEARTASKESEPPLDDLLTAVEQGVDRLHLLDGKADGSLLLELFTRDGIGTLISQDPFEAIRAATLEDLVDILGIVRPLEEAGVLVKRPRERLEMDLDQFIVTERDRTVIGCVSLTPYPEDRMAEMACLAILPEYQKEGRGEHLLEWCKKEAGRMGLTRLFVLTTQSSRWFIERGFRKAATSDIPVDRRSLYDQGRNSQILILDLSD